MVAIAAGLASAFLSQAGPPSHRVRFEVLRGGLITVRGVLGDDLPATLLVDTGTYRTVVDRAIAQRLQLDGVPDHLTTLGSTATPVDRVVLPALQFGPLMVTDVPVLSTDLAGLDARLGTSVDAIVGLDVLKGRCLTVDYAMRWLSFHCTDDWPSRLSLDRRSPFVVVMTTIDGSVQRLVVDTGSDAIVLFDRALARMGDVEIDGHAQADRLDDRVTLRRFTARQVAVGNSRLHNEPIFVIQGHDDTPGFDGVLGARRLARALQFDLERMVLSWRR